MSNAVSLGTKKKQFKSIKLAAAEAGISYITLYMRLRMGVKPSIAVKKPVRTYCKRSEDAQQEG